MADLERRLFQPLKVEGFLWLVAGRDAGEIWASWLEGGGAPNKNCKQPKSRDGLSLTASKETGT